MSAAALQKMMETAVMPLRMTSFLLEYQSTLGWVSFFPCVQSKTITWLGFRSKTVLQWPEERWKTSRRLAGECTLDQRSPDQRRLLMSPPPSPGPNQTWPHIRIIFNEYIHIRKYSGSHTKFIRIFIRLKVNYSANKYPITYTLPQILVPGLAGLV